MATLATSAVALYPTDNVETSQFYCGGVSGRQFVTRRLKLTLTGQGTTTNTITAAALGFTKLVSASSMWDADNSKGYPSVVDPVNNVLILLDGSAAPAPVDVTTAAGYISVTGVKTP